MEAKQCYNPAFNLGLGLKLNEGKKMRIEEIAAKALERVGNDRYVLSNLIFARSKELSNGAKPLVEGVELKMHKLTDIVMMEIAEGKIALTNIDSNVRR